MNPKSDSGCNKAGGSRCQKRGSGWLSDMKNPALFNPNVVPQAKHPYLPEITRQLLLDTSDSESEIFEAASSNSGNLNDPKSSSSSKSPRISPHGCDPSSNSSTRSSKVESLTSSTSDPRHRLRFVPSPHPDNIQRGLESPVTESNNSWESPGLRQFPTSHGTACNVNLASVDESSDSGGTFIASSLPESRFTLKTPRVIEYTETPLDFVPRNLGKEVVSHHCVNVLRPDHAICRRSDDESVDTRSSFFNVGPISNTDFNFHHCSPCQNRNVQKSFVGPAADVVPEPVGMGCRYPRSGSTSVHSAHFNQPVVSHLTTSTELPISTCCSVVPAMEQNLSSAHLPMYREPIQSDVGPIGSPHTDPVIPEKTTHQLYTLRQENVGSSDPPVPGRSAGELGNFGNIPSSSHSMTSRHTSGTIGFSNSNPSHLRSYIGCGNRNAPGTDLSNHNYEDVDTRTSDSFNQVRQVGSEPSDRGVVVMSLIHKKSKIASSSYNSSTGQVLLLESVTENVELSTTVLALRSVAPSIVVVPSSGAARYLKELKAKVEGDKTLKDCQFQCLSPRNFTYSFARRTILESPLWEGCLTFRSEDAKKNAIVSIVNLNDERLACAFGGLLYHLSTGCPQLGAGMSPSPITSVHHMKLNDKLWLDTESFKNLQIFDPAEHPSTFKWSSTNRDDGKSIFGLFERFCSSVGMTKLKSFLANPINCRKTLLKRHDVIDFYLNPSNNSTVEALRGFASQMSSSSVILNYLSSPTLRGGHWKHIYRHIYYTVSYAEVCRSHGDQSELFRELGSTIVDAVYSMAHNLERVVDLVNMENNETFVIKYGFHPPLDAAKEKFSRLKVAMDKVTPYEFDSVPSFINRIQMMYIPEMKFLLSIPYWAPDLSKEDLNLPNLEFKFAANKTAFYKTRRCYELDELLGDAQTDIINEESLIIQSLRNYLRKHMHHIVGMGQKIAEIECIFALAKVAREERYSKPEILDDCVIDIHGGWHPLLDVPSNEVITNDTLSSSEKSLVKVVYGLNASGKSIYLKQVGIIMYLVHVGSYVPAVSARVGLFRRILARTSLEESIMSMSSTMLSELKKLHDAVMGCAKDTLVILDEVGKGSTESNCIAIVTSAVNYFLSLSQDCPHVLISTHLSGIIDFVTPPPHCDGCRNLFELLVMDYNVTEGEIIFLYKVRRCSPNLSFVFEVLENSEFAAPIFKTARTVLEALRTGENFLPYCETRIQRSHKYLNFIRKFVNIDMAKPGYLQKLQNKIQRYYEKPSY